MRATAWHDGHWTAAAFVAAVSIPWGALGAAAVWWWRGQMQWSGDTIVASGAAMITLIGWFVTARMSDRSQRQLFLHHVINDARSIVVTAIRKDLDWSRAVAILWIQAKGQLAEDLRQQPRDVVATNIRWLERVAKARATLNNSDSFGTVTVGALEEHELLFPETRILRYQLSGFVGSRIFMAYSKALDGLTSPDTRVASVEELERLAQRNHDLTSLLEQLKVHIQNASWAEITGLKVRPKFLQDSADPALVVRDDGTLGVEQCGISWPSPTDRPPANPWPQIDAELERHGPWPGRLLRQVQGGATQSDPASNLR
jgi:hypothetical protein